MKYTGIIVPLITPLTDRDSLDREGLERLIEHVIDGGVRGIFVLGSTGEGPSLSYRLRGEVVFQTCRIVKGRVPVFVGISDPAFIESVNLSKLAAEAGADALVLSTPFYFPAGQTELQEYIQKLIPELPLPVMLYNMPALTKVWFETPTLEKLAEHDKIIGVKDSSGDRSYFLELIKMNGLRPDWSFFVGPEAQLIASTQAGGDGGISGGANIWPALFTEAWKAADTNDLKRCKELQAQITDLGRIYDIGKYASRFIKATKCATSLLGLCSDVMAEPFNKFYPEHREKVKEILNEVGLL